MVRLDIITKNKSLIIVAVNGIIADSITLSRYLKSVILALVNASRS